MSVRSGQVTPLGSPCPAGRVSERSVQGAHPPVAVLDRVSYLYPHSDRPALSNISLEIRRGEFLGLIGPTGAGKTTLCLALNGVVPQFYGGRFFGRATVAGLDSLDHPISRLARHVAVVFEDPETQITATSVENEIAFALENLCVPRDEILRRIAWALAAVRLEGTEKRPPHTLSGGEKQRLAIASSLALCPDLLVLDEPTSQLDPVGTQEVFATVRELNRTLGLTVVMASHAAEEMAEFSDCIAVLDRGEIVQVGPPDEVYADGVRLAQLHLRAPQVAETFALARGKGLSVPRIPVRLQEGIALARDLSMQHPLDQPVACPEGLAGHPLPGTDKAPLLSVRDLHYTYRDGPEALKGITLDLHAGEYVLLVGQNGAGKSTLVKHFLGLLRPAQGQVLLAGTDTRTLKVSALARRIGYVAQNPDHQIFNATVEEEVGFALRHLGFSERQARATVDESLAAMGLSDVRDRHPLALPRGDRARVVVATILAMAPEVIIFDEPTTGQDYRGAQAILAVSRRLHEQGKTIIVITHHLYLMADVAQRVIVMGAGRVLLDAPIREAYHADDVLASTRLTPPQAVLLAKTLHASFGMDDLCPLLTPAEVAGVLARTGGPRWDS